MSLDPYFYTKEPIIDFVLRPFEVVPAACSITYACEVVDGPKIFACTWDQPSGDFGAFD